MVKIPAEAKIQSLSLIHQDGEQTSIYAEGKAITIGDWQNIRLTTTSNEVLIEYIDPNLIKEGRQRTFEFNWHSSYTVSSIAIKLYQPAGISDIQTDPLLPSISDDTRPIPEYYRELGAVSANEYFSFSLSYIKENDEPAYPKLDVVPATPIDKGTTGRSASPLSVILWLLGVASSILIMVGVYAYWFRRDMQEKREQTYHGVGIMNPEKQVAFCHECGMLAQTGDNYCRNCGTRLHQSS